MEVPRKKYIIQESGSVTLPADFRKRFNLKPGDEISFVETDEGLLISPREALINRLLGEIGEELRTNGITAEVLMESGQDIKKDLLKEYYDIDSES